MILKLLSDEINEAMLLCDDGIIKCVKNAAAHDSLDDVCSN